MEHAFPSTGPLYNPSVVRVRASNFALFVLHIIFSPCVFARIGHYFSERIRNIRIKFQMSPNCHFGSLNLVRNSNREFDSSLQCIRFGQLKARNSSVLDLSSWILPTRPGSKVAVFAILCSAGMLALPGPASGPFRKLFCTKLVIRARWLGSPPGGTREGTLSCRHRGCTCQSFEATCTGCCGIQASDHFPKENNVKLTLVLCGAALRGSGSQQCSGREATTNALRCGQRQQRQAQQGQKQHV